MVSDTVITAFEDGINKKLESMDGGTKLMVHITDFVYTLDTVTDFYANEIKMKQDQKAREEKERKKVPMKVHLKRLNSVILTAHPALREWRNKSAIGRKLYDWKLRLQYLWELWSDVDSVRWGILAGALTKIQSNYGTSCS